MSKPTKSPVEFVSNEFALQPGDAFVAICDWNGVVKWLSNHTIKTQVGDFGWTNMPESDADRFKAAFSRTATLHESARLEIRSLDGLRYRIWLWSVGTPELAVCTFNLLIPTEIELLTPRERQFMECLATGATIKQIASELDVSVNTLHTHVRKIKSKLSLTSSSEVASFAAKFLHHHAGMEPKTK